MKRNTQDKSPMMEVYPIHSSLFEELAPVQFTANVLRVWNESSDAPLAYCHEKNEWFSFNGRTWEPMSQKSVLNLASEIVQEVIVQQLQQPSSDRTQRKELSRLLFLINSSNRYIRDGLERFAGQFGVSVRSSDFDADHFVLNCQNGVLDLRTLKLHPHSADYRCRKIVNAKWDPDAECPHWKRFLHRIFGGDESLIRYVQMVCGTALLGINPQQEVYFLYGTGANGKSTFLRTLKYVLGSYAGVVQEDAIISKFGHDAKTRALSALEGIRMGILYDTDVSDDSQLNVGALKVLCENEKVVVRGVYEKPREVFFGVTLFCAVNQKPDVHDYTDGAWRRIRLVPFIHQIPEHERDPLFAEKYLYPEASGILAWMTEGLRAYYELREQNQPLVNPIVQSETESWRDESCPIRAWLNDNVVPDPNGVIFYDEILAGVSETSGEWISLDKLGKTLKRIHRIHGQTIATRRINTTDEQGNLVKKRAVIGFRRRTPNDTPPSPTPPPSGKERVADDGNETKSVSGPLGPLVSNIFPILKGSGKSWSQSGPSGPNSIESSESQAIPSIRSLFRDDDDGFLPDDDGGGLSESRGAGDKMEVKQMTETTRRDGLLEGESLIAMLSTDGDDAVQEPTADNTEHLRRMLLRYGEQRGYPRIVVWLRVFEGEESWRSDLMAADHARLVLWADALALNDHEFADYWRESRAGFV